MSICRDLFLPLRFRRSQSYFSQKGKQAKHSENHVVSIYGLNGKIEKSWEIYNFSQHVFSLLVEECLLTQLLEANNWPIHCC